MTNVHPGNPMRSRRTSARMPALVVGAAWFAAAFFIQPAAAQCDPNWNQPAALQAGPIYRTASAMVFDSARGEFVLFGGFGSTLQRLGDTWTANGAGPSAVWTSRPQPPSPAPYPANRGGHAMTFDSLRGRVLLFGGTDQNHLSLNDLWAWDGTEWTLLHDGVIDAPSSRKEAMFVYDPSRDRAVLFGGFGGAGSSAETWEWTGTNWLDVTPPSSTDPSPARRTQAAGAFDPVRNAVILFGGLTPGLRQDDTWSWDGQRWTQLSVVGPSARFASSSWFDIDRHVFVIYGGSTDSGRASDVWELDLIGWTQRTPSSIGIGGQSSIPAAYDQTAGVALLVGGPSTTSPAENWTLTFNDRVQIITPPGSMTIPAGRTLELNIQAAGASPLTFLWRHNGAILVDGSLGGRVSGAGTASLHIAALQNGDEGLYDVVMTNACGSTISTAATIAMSPPCVADIDDGTGSGIPDGAVGVEDLLYYASRFEAGDPRADTDNGDGSGGADGGIGIEDLLYFLARYDAGC